MKQKEEIVRLRELAQMVLDVRLADLARVARQRQSCLDGLKALEALPASDLDPVTAAQVALSYQAWADGRRSELNVALARCTAEWTSRTSSARTALARAEALRRL
ncbi:hypothetical protein ACN9JG_15000 [Cereibacter azotoformans]|uniref:hypothetical protein n=1 Tax=Cereibacter azotoformans TaxID=43057 RepID=UPI0005C668FB|nr:hypothetical protein D0Z66_15010 [Cereibacter sphaeroides]